MSWLLETEKSARLAVHNAIRVRRATGVIVGLATLAILFAQLVELQSSNFGGTIWNLLVPELWTVIYLAYFWLVFWLLIFSKPPDGLYWQRLWFPAIILLAYSAYVVAAVIKYRNFYGPVLFLGAASIKTEKSVRLTAEILFLLLYLLWFFRDLLEYRATADGERKQELHLWFLIELVILALLGARLVIDFGYKGVASTIDRVANKDVAIFISLAFWLGYRWFKRDTKSQTFRDNYEKYLTYTKVQGTTPTHLTCANLPSVRAVLDFGCGNGVRLIQALDWMGLTNSTTQLEVIGHDLNNLWSDSFQDTLSRNGIQEDFVSFTNDIDAVPWDRVGLIVVSHVIYDRRAAKDLVRALRKAKKGTIVVLRGTTPRSFFAAASAASGLQIFRPSVAHLWARLHLADVATAAKLKRLSSDARRPDGIVQQSFSLTRESVRTIKAIISSLYGYAVGENVARYLTDLREGKVSEVPNEDALYLFETSQH